MRTPPVCHDAVPLFPIEVCEFRGPQRHGISAPRLAQQHLPGSYEIPEAAAHEQQEKAAENSRNAPAAVEQNVRPPAYLDEAHAKGSELAEPVHHERILSDEVVLLIEPQGQQGIP